MVEAPDEVQLVNPAAAKSMFAVWFMSGPAVGGYPRKVIRRGYLIGIPLVPSPTQVTDIMPKASAVRFLLVPLP